MSEFIECYWRDATPADAIKEPPMVARFRDSEVGQWRIATLDGHNRAIGFKWGGAGFWWKICQVYDAPDPGERWRFIDVEREEPQAGDQYLCPISNVWCFCNEWARMESYSKDSVVRRRIEPPKPKYVPFEWQDREQLRGRWIYQVGDENYQEMINKMDFGNNEFYANNKSARQLLNDWHFRDTGEPVGKRVV